MSSLNLKGIWIPTEILLDTKLSDKEKIIYSLIIFLSKENKYCYCTNKTFSELLNISTTQVSKLINSLKSKKYIHRLFKIICKLNYEIIFIKFNLHIDICTSLIIASTNTQSVMAIKIVAIADFFCGLLKQGSQSLTKVANCIL